MEWENEAIQCPVLECDEMCQGLDGIKHHLVNIHGIQIKSPSEGGFSCHLCGRNFVTYRWWKNHVIQNHLAGAPENNVANENNPDVDDAGGLEMYVDVNLDNVNEEPEIGFVAEPGARNVDYEMDVDVDDVEHGNHEVLQMDADVENDDEFGSDMSVEPDTSDWSSESEEEQFGDERLGALEALPDGRKNIKHAATNMIVEMRGVSAMTRVGVRRAMQGSDLVLRVNNLSLKDDVYQYLASVNLNDTPEARNLLSKFDCQSPYKGMMSNAGQISAIQKFYQYLKPETVFIEDRLDQRLEENGEYIQRPVPNSYEFVSPKNKILKLVASHPEVMEYIRSNRPSQDGMLSSYMDGDEYRRHPLFQEQPDAFQLCLYEDEVDPARSQGSKSGIHELANFSLRILNLPPHINSTLGSVFPFLLANANDCKGTYEAVLRRFVDELRELERGVRLFVNGAFITIYAALVAVKADSKSAHAILGFLGCGARHFCRQCMISRQELHEGVVAFGERRTPEMSESQLPQVELNPDYSTQCGLRYRTVLHDSRYFRAENNCNFDLMHDANEAMIPMVIRLCLKQFVVVEDLFNVDELNQRIFAFNYGKQNIKDKPNPRFTLASLREAHRVYTYTMKQNAVQMMVLFRALPFILDNIGGNEIPEDNQYLQMLLHLLKIIELAMAPRIPRGAIPMLRRMLEVFRISW